jgi:hypothetical protein
MNIKRILAITALAAIPAFAQAEREGAITITGSVPEVISMTSSTNGAATATGSLGELTPRDSSALARFGTPVEVRIRSNKRFNLTAHATFSSTGTGAADGGLTLSAGDIGFGVIAKDASGNNVVADREGDAIVEKFDYTGAGFDTLPITNGRTPFDGTTHGTLAQLTAAPITIVTGKRISKAGTIQSNDNFLQFRFDAAVLPQYFTPTTSFTATITFTAATY